MRPAPDKVERVAVIGAGTIGASWATLFLSKGLEVVAHDPRSDGEDHLKRFIDEAWPALERLGLDERANPSKLRFVDDPSAAVAEAAFVQESGPENLQAKRDLYAKFEPALTLSSVVASSTSGFMPSELRAGRVGPERYLVGHPFNPPHLIPLVEVVGGPEADPAVVDWAVAFYGWLGKKAIRIDKEMPGHVANRMQAALYREAVHLVLDGVATPADVDAAIAYGPGLRWALLGPHALHELAGGKGGMRHHLEHLGPGVSAWWADLGRPEITPETIDRLVAAYEADGPAPVEKLAAERDRLLLALLQVLARERAVEGKAKA
ncbi:MAG: 3-hydroxyacyl-CoA dehydrogenase NAD-binding domain-containing protein [Alphaproteobacteria bacterium]